MAKSPRIRHSKDRSEPVTIDLAAADTTIEPPVTEEMSPAPDSAPDPVETAEAPAAPHAEAGSPAPSPQPAKGRGVGSLLAAGLVGGALAGGGIYAYDRIMPAAGAPDLKAELSSRDAAIAGLAESIAAAKTDVGTLRGDLDALKGELAGLKAAGAPAPDLSGIEARMAEMETRIAGLAAGTVPADPALAGRLDAVGKTAADAAAAASAAGESAARTAEAVVALSARVDTLAADVAKAGAGGNGLAPAVARAIAAAALKSAIDRGQPFMAELETFASVAPEAAEIEQLRAFAASGVPGRAELGDEATSVANAILSASRQSSPDAGILQRLFDSARALVTVRPIGMVEGTGVEAVAARMEAQVQAGRLEAALAEIASLTGPAAEAAAALKARIEARLAVDALIDKALSAALSPASGG